MQNELKKRLKSLKASSVLSKKYSHRVVIFKIVLFLSFTGLYDFFQNFILLYFKVRKMTMSYLLTQNKYFKTFIIITIL